MSRMAKKRRGKNGKNEIENDSNSGRNSVVPKMHVQHTYRKENERHEQRENINYFQM